MTTDSGTTRTHLFSVLALLSSAKNAAVSARQIVLQQLPMRVHNTLVNQRVDLFIAVAGLA